jgi:hypothetical protein
MYCELKRGRVTGDEILSDLMSCVGVYEKYQNYSENLVKEPQAPAR